MGRLTPICCALVLLAAAGLARAADPDDILVTYLERYHQLEPTDVDARLALADWCADHHLPQQQADLLLEVLKLRPDHESAYRDLLKTDARRHRPIDPQWARKLLDLLGPGHRLHHTAHFTLITNADEPAAQLQADAMEQAYALFYRAVPAIGLRPLPPDRRLVCVLFERYDDYRDYLRRLEATDAAWTSGYYSWKTNRVAFFHDRDNPVFADVRRQIALNDKQMEHLRQEMRVSTRLARQVEIQQQLKDLTASNADLHKRLSAAARLATLGKSLHESAHQLFHNSGVLRRDRGYPFWLNEGLACCFELCDADGRAGPEYVNRYRLKTYRNSKDAGRLRPLQDLLSHHPKDDQDVSSVAADYAQAWALTHFLWNRRPAQLKQYISAGPDGTLEQFRQHFGQDIGDLDRQLQAYVGSL